MYSNGLKPHRRYPINKKINAPGLAEGVIALIIKVDCIFLFLSALSFSWSFFNRRSSMRCCSSEIR